MKDMILFPEDIDRLDAILLPLTQKANLLLAVLINKDGRLLTNQGQLESVDIVSLAALVAGNTASTLAIAHLVGETEFCTMYHQGKDKHIYVASIDDNTFLALVFDDRTNIDRVKVFARQFDRQLKEALQRVYDKSEEQVDLDMDVNKLLFGAGPKPPVTTAPQAMPMPQQPPPRPTQQPQQQPGGDVYYMDMNSAARPQQTPTAPQQQQNQPGQQGGDPSMMFLQKKIRESKHK
ncbi:MAG: roadblock/LC7 domain-containing protein [Chitinispirillales bacterium]|jgi:predicted regulator of Ras-like GTPase activity (Roadblock/LC7/MglB family)|nr:roadblock/LC7 domain-containing protein [Chitinispirillales bacterium]